MMKIGCRRQHGAIAIMTALFLVILIGFAAFALDLGRLYLLRTEMQNAVDAAALAAAAELNGQEFARSRAVVAASKLMQSHQGTFSTEKELIDTLDSHYDPAIPQSSTLVFYSWIGHELDGEKPNPCTENPEDPPGSKCLADDDSNAHYVKVKLYPELMDGDYYGIDLYFIPILGLFVGEPMTYAATRVEAVAGAGSYVCNLPPMFMCAFGDDPYAGMTIGGQVRLKDRDASEPWGPGNVGFLRTAGDVILYEDDDYDSQDSPIHLSGTQAISAALANEKTNPCSPAIVSTSPGVTTQQTRKGFNTRFGIYEEFDDFKKSFPPAPNVVDYPRDDIFIDPDTEETAGTGWPTTECLATGSSLPTNEFCHDATRPEQFNIGDYFTYYHGASAPAGLSSRHSIYEWELSQATPQLPSLAATHPDVEPLDDTNNFAQFDCFDENPNQIGQKNCLVHNGDPTDNDDAYSTTYPVIGDADRRVLFVAVIQCDDYNIQGSSPDIDLLNYGGFHKFFVTQHVQPPPYAEFFAEYLGPVSDEEEQTLIHTVVQLYE